MNNGKSSIWNRRHIIKSTGIAAYLHINDIYLSVGKDKDEANSQQRPNHFYLFDLWNKDA